MHTQTTNSNAFTTRRTALQHLSILACVVYLTGCASSENLRNYLPVLNELDTRAYEQMYLRGVFNWWEAEPAYLLQAAAQHYIVDVELIADGQPYDFKFADQAYTPHLTCGSTAPQGKTLLLDDVSAMSCHAGAGNFKFIPQETGTYRFTVSPGQPAELKISRL